MVICGCLSDWRRATLTQLYSEARAYVQISIYESFGLNPIEAQLNGTAAVVWGDACVQETVDDGRTGFHTKPCNVTDFSEKRDILLSDERVWREMSRNSRTLASAFNWKARIDLLE